MGPTWNEEGAGDLEIINGRARARDYGTVIFNGQTAMSVTADVYKINGGVSDYCAIVLGYQDADNNLYIKVQTHDGQSNFHALGFYFGDTGNSNHLWPESFFGDIPTPFSSARLTVSLVGSNASLEIDTDFDGTPEQTITRGSVPVHLLGSGIGLAGWNAVGAEVDNFSITPEPATLVLLAAGLPALLKPARRRS